MAAVGQFAKCCSAQPCFVGAIKACSICRREIAVSSHICACALKQVCHWCAGLTFVFLFLPHVCEKNSKRTIPFVRRHTVRNGHGNSYPIKLEPFQRKLAWQLRKDDTHKSRNVLCLWDAGWDARVLPSHTPSNHSGPKLQSYLPNAG